MRAVYKKEMILFSHTMQAYLFMAGILLGGGLLFSYYNIIGKSMDLKPVWRGLLYIELVLVPVLTMRLMAGEHAGGTDLLLMTSPVSAWGVTMGKFLAALAVLASSLGLTLIYPLILCLFGSPSWARIAAGYCGVFLLGMLVISVGLFMSSLVKRPLSALLSTMGVALFVILADMAAAWFGNGVISTAASWVLPFCSAAYFTNGFLTVPAFVYFISITALFLYLTIRSIEHAKWSKGRRL